MAFSLQVTLTSIPGVELSPGESSTLRLPRTIFKALIVSSFRNDPGIERPNTIGVRRAVDPINPPIWSRDQLLVNPRTSSSRSCTRRCAGVRCAEDERGCGTHVREESRLIRKFRCAKDRRGRGTDIGRESRLIWKFWDGSSRLLVVWDISLLFILGIRCRRRHRGRSKTRQGTRIRHGRQASARPTHPSIDSVGASLCLRSRQTGTVGRSRLDTQWHLINPNRVEIPVGFRESLRVISHKVNAAVPARRDGWVLVTVGEVGVDFSSPVAAKVRVDDDAHVAEVLVDLARALLVHRRPAKVGDVRYAA